MSIGILCALTFDSALIIRYVIPALPFEGLPASSRLRLTSRTSGHAGSFEKLRRFAGNH